MLYKSITVKEIDTIFDTVQRKTEYLQKLVSDANLRITVPDSIYEINRQIINTWNYMFSKRILRNMFFESDKYIHGVNCKKRIDFLINDWHNKGLGSLDWPFSAMGYDAYIAKINRRENLSEEQKDDIAARDTIRFRRIKDINACRNDYIENLIVYHNDNIIPTFGHIRGVDFYINGCPFDQKVSRGIGRAFLSRYPENAYETAVAHPELVAKSLYENQDEERFDYDPRLYIIYLDNDISSTDIEQAIIETDFKTPMKIQFSYNHAQKGKKEYTTSCYVLLLRRRACGNL